MSASIDEWCALWGTTREVLILPLLALKTLCLKGWVQRHASCGTHNCILFPLTRRIPWFGCRSKSCRSHRYRTTTKLNYHTRRFGCHSWVIYYLETYDVTTVRASTPKLMARAIKALALNGPFLAKAPMNCLAAICIVTSSMHKPSRRNGEKIKKITPVWLLARQ